MDGTRMHRRGFLARLGAGALGISGLAAALAACGDGDGSGAAVPTAAASTTVPIDPSTPWWLRGDFAPVTEEVEAFDLDVRGALPPTLDGVYVRNGSNARSGTSGHWFLGDGMLHGVRLESGRASWYRNRWVRTALFEADADYGSGPPGGASSQSNVSVVHHGGRLLTLGEIGFPYEVSPEDLSTVGVHDFAGRLTTSMTAHPKVDPATGRMHFFGYGFVPPYLTYHVADSDGTLVSSEEIEVAGPTMMHDFAITDRDAVFWELPVLFDLDLAAQGEGFPFRWDPSYGARVGVMPLGGPASAIRWVEIDPCYVFHGVNAFRDGDDVVLDVCRFPSMFADGPAAMGPPGALHRWRIGTGGDAPTFADEVLEGERRIDLPTHDPRVTGRPHRYGWFAETFDDPDTVVLGGVVRRDFRTGALETWDPGPGRSAGEGLFVPDGDGDGEGEGWVLTYRYDAGRDGSDLVVLDATDLAAGPVAAVALPRRVPYGFHATWVEA